MSKNKIPNIRVARQVGHSCGLYMENNHAIGADHMTILSTRKLSQKKIIRFLYYHINVI
jgi:hypothetical protein